MAEKVVCNKCGESYEDKESIDLAKKWIKEGYAPCPNITCPGELILKEGRHYALLQDGQRQADSDCE